MLEVIAECLAIDVDCVFLCNGMNLQGKAEDFVHSPKMPLTCNSDYTDIAVIKTSVLLSKTYRPCIPLIM